MLDHIQISFLNDLLHTNSPSGFECSVVSFLKDRMSGVCDMETDRIGNLYMYTNRSKKGLKVLISAHSDEVGFQVTHIDKDGYIYFRKVASADRQVIPGSRVVILTSQGDVQGVVGKKSPHVMNSHERDEVPDISSLWIDCGFESDIDATHLIKSGDYITLSTSPIFTPTNKIISKALDNKICVYILTELARIISQENLPINVVCVATSQEEIGCRGSIVATNRLKPDVAICLDVDIATDIPNMQQSRFGSLKLGMGPGIMRNADNNPILFDLIKDVAKAIEVPIQVNAGITATGGTETSKIIVSAEGVATINICIPNRYMHSAAEMCDLRDVEATIKLLINLISKLSEFNTQDFNIF